MEASRGKRKRSVLMVDVRHEVGSASLPSTTCTQQAGSESYVRVSGKVTSRHGSAPDSGKSPRRRKPTPLPTIEELRETDAREVLDFVRGPLQQVLSEIAEDSVTKGAA